MQKQASSSRGPSSLLRIEEMSCFGEGQEQLQARELIELAMLDAESEIQFTDGRSGEVEGGLMVKPIDFRER